MAVRRWLAGSIGVALPVLAVVLLLATPALAVSRDARIQGTLAGLRVPFVPNQGQTDPRVAYYAQTFAGTLFVTRQGELVYGLAGPTRTTPRGSPPLSPGPGWTLTETFVNGVVRPRAEEPSATGVSSFRGDAPARWQPALPAYERLGLDEVWPGVTVALHARGRSVEKVFTVRPGASVRRIRLRVGGADALSVNAAGALVAATGLGPVTFTAPVAYQERDGVRRDVPVRYRLRGRDYGFTVGAYDRGVPLVIDPLLQSTYLGGNDQEEGFALAIHLATGDVYVAGYSRSLDFPGTAGGAQPARAAPTDAFVARLNSALTSLLQATYLGGNGNDFAFGLAIHPASGDVYVAGITVSSDFPNTAGGAQPVFGGGHFTLGNQTPPDSFVARLDSGLTTLTQATYFGTGAAAELAASLAIHPATGDVYVTGTRVTEVFVGPPADGDARARFVPVLVNDAFVIQLNESLTVLRNQVALAVSETTAVTVHPLTGEVYVAGTFSGLTLPSSAGGAQPTNAGELDAFVMRLSSALAGPIQSTFLGGSDRESAGGLAIDPVTGDVYVTGSTKSTDFPVTPGAAQVALAGFFDGYVARFNSALTALLAATYFGGSSDDIGRAVAIQAATGDVYVVGVTSSLDLPGRTGGAQPDHAGFQDAFAARLTASLTTIIQATYLGGTGADDGTSVAIHPLTADVYMAGTTDSGDLAGRAGGAQPSRGGSIDAFVSRLTFGLAATDPLFADVLPSHPFLAFIEALARAGITTGCAVNPPLYCPGLPVTRAQMAVFLERGIHGAAFEPPPATGTMFADVTLAHLLAAWIEQFALDGITSGCSVSPPLYCPGLAVTRGAMAVFIVRAVHGAGFEPPPATGTMFIDVPPFHPFAAFIEQLARDGITSGCTPFRYCPDAPVTRGEMAVFLVRAFGL